MILAWCDDHRVLVVAGLGSGLIQEVFHDGLRWHALEIQRDFPLSEQVFGIFDDKIRRYFILGLFLDD